MDSFQITTGVKRHQEFFAAPIEICTGACYVLYSRVRQPFDIINDINRDDLTFANDVEHGGHKQCAATHVSAGFDDEVGPDFSNDFLVNP